jgi:hypothetical protein
VQHVITDKLRLAIDLARDLAPAPKTRRQNAQQSAALHAS